MINKLAFDGSIVVAGPFFVIPSASARSSWLRTRGPRAKQHLFAISQLMYSDELPHGFDQTVFGLRSGQKNQHAACYLRESNLYLRLQLALPCFG